jgi:L-threonylcarbamoyladenylate synthase
MIDNKQVEQLVKVLRAGGVVIFPTDTVWGMGAWINSREGITKLYALKKRQADKPTAVLVGSLKQAEEYGVFSRKQRWVMQKYWPGALTVIVPAKAGVPKSMVNSKGGIGIRWPKSELVKQVCLALGGAVVASSANVAGSDPPVAYHQVDPNLKAAVEMTVKDMGELSGTASTVVDWTGETAKIVRQGEVVLK